MRWQGVKEGVVWCPAPVTWHRLSQPLPSLEVLSCLPSWGWGLLRPRRGCASPPSHWPGREVCPAMGRDQSRGGGIWSGPAASDGIWTGSQSRAHSHSCICLHYNHLCAPPLCQAECRELWGWGLCLPGITWSLIHSVARATSSTPSLPHATSLLHHRWLDVRVR